MGVVVVEVVVAVMVVIVVWVVVVEGMVVLAAKFNHLQRGGDCCKKCEKKETF